MNPESEISNLRSPSSPPSEIDPPLRVPLNARLFLLTCCGIGGRWPASGTWGSMPPVGLALLLVWALGGGHEGWETLDLVSLNVALALVAMAFTIVCVRFGAEAETCYACKDPRHVVADEVAGQSIALLFAGTAFLMFRAMDIIKPPPARGLQRLPCGWGIVVDDLIAGVYALLLTQVFARWAWPALLGNT